MISEFRKSDSPIHFQSFKVSALYLDRTTMILFAQIGRLRSFLCLSDQTTEIFALHLDRTAKIFSFALTPCCLDVDRTIQSFSLEHTISSNLEDFSKDLKASTFILLASPLLGSRSHFLECATPPELDLLNDFDLPRTSCFSGNSSNSDPKILEKNSLSPSWRSFALVL
jgi:hypothetical protein